MLKLLNASLLCFLLLSACGKEEKQEEQEEQVLHTLPFEAVALNDLSDFQSKKGNNWQVAGAVYANRNEEHHLEMTEGNGILTNIPNESNKDNLFTVLEHGDMDIELDFMMPKGSNSGIYFQGRYEVQLFDSWLKDTVTFGDCGGIYQRFDFANDKGFEGTKPLVNASKAPGLWQHLKIRFRAPRFDASGAKISNARFDWVYLNDVLVQKNVEVTGHTLGAAFDDEQAAGPLMIQGDHGPIAFRNIRYRAYDLGRIKLGDIEMKRYESMYTNTDTLESLQPIETKMVDSLSYTYYNEFQQAVFNAPITVPKDGDYLFILQSGGPSWLFIDGDLVVDNDSTGNYFSPGYQKVHLSKGEHDFKLIYNNRHGGLTLNYEGPGIPLTRLTATGSAKIKEANTPLNVEVKEDPVVQRGFMVNNDIKRTHMIAVGIPGGINYSYDLQNFSVLHTWHGGFIDAADMWQSRGEQQLMIPLGGIVELQNLPTLRTNASENKASGADSQASNTLNFTNSGYQLSENGLPVFFYSLENAEVRDYLFPAANNLGLVREIRVDFDEPDDDLYCRIATGRIIEKLPDGSYAIDDKNYYVADLESAGADPVITKEGDFQSLVVPVRASNRQETIRFSLIW